jgi:glycosyltransferase involved in cell wall biosynthesis
MSVEALRILHVVPYFEHAWAYGGIPRLATTMTRALARRGHHVSVYTTDVQDERSRTQPGRRCSEGVEVRTFRNVSNRLAYHLQVFTPLGLRRELRTSAGAFDVAHLHACHNFPVAMAAAALSKAGVPYVVAPNGTARSIERRILAKRLFAATVGRHLLTRAARVIAVTRVERDQLVADGVPPASITIVPNPLEEANEFTVPDGSRFRQAHRLHHARIVLFLGKLTPRKRVEDLIHAFAILNRQDCVLVIAGNDMGAGRSVDALVRQLRLESRVVRTGLLHGTDRLDALEAADVVVYPSQDEIFGLVPLESLICGTPVVVCADSGCGEVIRTTGGGLVVRHGDPAALRDAVAEILDDPAGWKARVRPAAARARGLFGADIVCAQLERVYADACGLTLPAVRQPA